MLHLLRSLHDATAVRSLCLAGGVALNCVSNAEALAAGPFEELFVQPAAHDAGTAIGAALIVAHNHPSGEPEPSAADRAITERLREAVDLVDVRLLDHVVVGERHTVSFAERGWFCGMKSSSMPGTL